MRKTPLAREDTGSLLNDAQPSPSTGDLQQPLNSNSNSNNNNNNGRTPITMLGNLSNNLNSDSMLAPTSQDMFVDGGGNYYSHNNNDDDDASSATHSYTATTGTGTGIDSMSNTQYALHRSAGGSSMKTKKSNMSRNYSNIGIIDSGGAAGTEHFSDYGSVHDGSILSYNRASSSLLQRGERDNMQYPNAYFFVFLACFPIFAGYGVLVSLQERLRKRMGIDGNSPYAQTFDYAVSTLFYVILGVRFFHNVIFSCLQPRGRVVLGYISLIVSMMLLVIFLFWVDNAEGQGKYANPDHLWFVFLCYVLGGIGISTFECNFVSCITPLGPTSKKWAIAAMPVGYSGLSIAAFAFFAFEPENESFVWITFLAVAVANVLGLLFFVFKVPHIPFDIPQGLSIGEFLGNFSGASWRLWVVPLLPNLLAFLINMFCVILNSGGPEYVYNVPRVPIVPHSSKTVGKNVFLAIFNGCAFLGDLTSRFVGYRVKDFNKYRFSPLEILVLTIIGSVMAMSTVAVIAWPGMFLVMFGNGFIYSSSMRRLDRDIDRRFHLTALSMLLLVGDAGSCIGSTLTHALSRAVGTAG